MIASILKIGIPAILTFLVGIVLTPSLTRWMYARRMWKRVNRHTDNTDEFSESYRKIHNGTTETSTPRVGGVIIWSSVLVVTFVLFALSRLLPNEILLELDYLSRGQTFLPLITFVFGAVFGLAEDILEAHSDRFEKFIHGFSRKALISVTLVVAISFAAWFFIKLDYRSIVVPFVGEWHIGWLFIPYFIVVMLGTFSSRVIDGMDGLSGGVLAIIFAAFGLIAIAQQQFDIAALCFVIASGLLAFLWFNIAPARFYMGETGMYALTLTLPVIAFLLHKSFWILIIGFPLVATSFTSFSQIIAKKYFGKKLYPISPLHHYFESIGWSREKVVMRYWIFTMMVSLLGVVIALLS
ncbi:hypothetical protein H6776_00850 [Candidatus Nomurabacteria bacterium]|nr:hypothetical protein [Candidatus Nomurabacteria bacterium]